MKDKKFWLVVLSLCFCASCVSKERDHSAKPRRIHRVDTIWLNKTRVDSSDFGFDSEGTGLALGISGIAVDGEYMFVSDDLFGNIKKVGLRDGKVVAISKTLSTRYRDVSTLYFDRPTGRLFCMTSFQDKIYVLNPNLVLVDEIKTFKSRKEFRLNGQDIVFWFSIQGEKYFTEDLKVIPKQVTTNPLNFELGTCGGASCLSNRYGDYEFPWIVKGCEYLSVESIAFDEDHVIYLDDRESLKYRAIVVSYK